MPPRKTRAAKAEASKEEAAPDATVSPAKAATPKRGGRKSARNNAQAEEEEEVGEQVETEQTSTQADEPSAEPSVAVTEPATPKGKAAAKGKGARHQPLAPSASTAEAQDAADQETREEAVSKPDANGKGKGKAREEETEADESGAATSKPTLEDRMEKLRLLRQKMNDSTRANRKDLMAEHQRQRTSAKAEARMERKMAEAEKVLSERDMRERGEDVERARAWEYSIEDNERWEKKLEERERKKDQGPVDFADAAERSYQRQISQLKPDLARYNAQRAALNGAGSSSSSGSSQALVSRSGPGGSGKGQVVRHEDLYRDYNSLSYGDHKPDDAAIDRVVGNINLQAEERGKRSRKRMDNDDGDVTYINERNKQFNNKIKRYFDKYTEEIRNNFERGTAL